MMNMNKKKKRKVQKLKIQNYSVPMIHSVHLNAVNNPICLAIQLKSIGAIQFELLMMLIRQCASQ